MRQGVVASIVWGIVAASALPAQETRIHGFTDVTATASSAPGQHSAFALGQYDLFITSKLSQRISFLGETVFEFEGEDFHVDVERLIVTFNVSPAFAVSAGRHHTPFGYWNTAYHHGTVMQPTIERPLMFRFEDDGGPLPVHTIGVAIAGRDLSSLHLGYDLMVGNGIGGNSISDNNNAKSVTAAVHSQITSRLRVGASAYFDHLASGTLSLAGDPIPTAIRHRMFGGFLAYLGPRLELFAELQHARNQPSGTGAATEMTALYGYAGFRIRRFVPYARYDNLAFPEGDAYYAEANRRLGLIGARFDLASTTTLKLELQRERLLGAGRFNQVAVQIAVGF